MNTLPRQRCKEPLVLHQPEVDPKIREENCRITEGGREAFWHRNRRLGGAPSDV